MFDRRIWAESGCLTVAVSGCLTVDNSPNPQRSVDNPGKRPSEASAALGGGKVPLLAFGRSWTILELLTEALWAGRGCNRGLGGKEDQHALGRRIVQLRPSHLDLLQLAQGVLAEIINSACVVRLGRIDPELAVERRPGEPQRSAEREGAVDKPEVEIEAQGERLSAARVFMSSGTGCWMISLNNFSPNSILLSHSEYSSGLRSSHQNSPRSTMWEAMNRLPRSSS